MNFSDAMNVVLNYSRACRKDWHRPVWIYIIVDEMGGPTQYVDQIVMKMVDGKMNAYTPSQCDMLANDWMEIPYCE